MGIKNFYKFIEKYCPSAIKSTNITDYKKSIIGIDANLMVHKIVFAIRKNGYDIQNNGINVTHIHGLLLKFKVFEKLNIKPVFVFDGEMPAIKSGEINKRKIFWQKLNEKYVTTQDKKYYYAKSPITDLELEECKKLIRICGYNVIEAPEEADSQLAQLIKNNLINYVASDDMDILLFGSDILLKKFTTSSKKKIQEINLETLKSILNISQNDLIKLGVLLGSDYCDNTPISINKAYKIIKNIEPNDIENKCGQAIEHFKKPKNINITKLKERKFSKNKLVEFLKSFQFSNDYVSKILENFEK